MIKRFITRIVEETVKNFSKKDSPVGPTYVVDDDISKRIRELMAYVLEEDSVSVEFSDACININMSNKGNYVYLYVNRTSFSISGDNVPTVYFSDPNLYNDLYDKAYLKYKDYSIKSFDKGYNEVCNLLNLRRKMNLNEIV